jgi:hypothetical protein
MRFLCLWSPEEVSPVALLATIPRVVVAHDVLWGDVHGMPLQDTVDSVQRALAARNVASVRIGVSDVPVAARIAALYDRESVTYVRAGTEQLFLAQYPVAVLEPSQLLSNFLTGVGIETCADLARLTQEACEVRLGHEGVTLWRLARAEDPRPIFGSIPRTLPSASLEWTDYTLRRAERLLFVINHLCGNVCTALRERGEGAIAMTLRFALANKTVYEHSLRAARATASQNAWMRLLRLELERIVLSDAVIGISLNVDLVGPLGGKQGDVFDLGFGTAHAAEEAIAGLLDDQGAIVVEPQNTLHPLLDRRTTWAHLDAAEAIERHTARTTRRAKNENRRTRRTFADEPVLTLQLLPEPLRITVGTVKQHDEEHPRTYRDRRQSYRIVQAAGPDRVSGGRWETSYARDYYRCVNDAGMLIWIYRDVSTSAWYLHGWWD